MEKWYEKSQNSNPREQQEIEDLYEYSEHDREALIEAYDRTPEATFRYNLRIELKKRIKDFIKIYYVDDTLLVEFYHTGQLSTVYIESNISEKMRKGIDSSELGYKIYKWYKGVITSRYFYD